MKNLHILIIFLFAAFIITSCKKDAAKDPPTVNFTFTGDNNPAPCSVIFTNLSTNATSYSWDFGDGTAKSGIQNPQHTYTSGGTFNVILVATGDGGSNSANRSVTILDPLPVANFSFSGNTNLPPCQVNFVNSSTNASTYVWDFGDGTQTSTQQNPQHTFTAGGTYSVQLTATGSGGSNSTTKSVSIPYPVPVANFSFTGANNTAPCTVSFTNTSTNATSYIWDFGDGSQTSTLTNPQHTYNAGGTFAAQLTATSPGGSNAITKYVVILNPASGTNVTFNNPVFTDMYVTLNGTTLTISPGGSVTFYSVSGSSVYYSAYTYGVTTSNTQIGLELDWANTIPLPGGTVSYNLVVTSSYFFLYMTNQGTHNLTPIDVNYGLSDQTSDNILIPNDYVKYRTGYYLAYTNTEVAAFYEDEPSYYTYWYNINFPWTINQSISLVNTYTKDKKIDPSHSAVLNPQRLIPAGNIPQNMKIDPKAINLYCK